MKFLRAFVILVFVSTISFAQKDSKVIDNDVHKIVMQFTVGDSTEQSAVVAQVANIRAAWPKSQIEVVCHSSGLNLLITAKSKVSQKVADLASQGIIFAACNNSMTRLNVKKEDLLPASTVVPSAMIEIVSKEEKGWSYVKGAH